MKDNGYAKATLPFSIAILVCSSFGDKLALLNGFSSLIGAILVVQLFWLQ